MCIYILPGRGKSVYDRKKPRKKIYICTYAIHIYVCKYYLEVVSQCMTGKSRGKKIYIYICYTYICIYILPGRGESVYDGKKYIYIYICYTYICIYILPGRGESVYDGEKPRKKNIYIYAIHIYVYKYYLEGVSQCMTRKNIYIYTYAIHIYVYTYYLEGVSQCMTGKKNRHIHMLYIYMCTYYLEGVSQCMTEKDQKGLATPSFPPPWAFAPAHRRQTCQKKIPRFEKRPTEETDKYGRNPVLQRPIKKGSRHLHIVDLGYLSMRTVAKHV